MKYMLKQWRKLVVYIEDGRLNIDNNLCENAVRPFVMGRKSWLFATSVAGANASANLYSLVETAKANGHEPYAYLLSVFTKLPAAKTLENRALETVLLAIINFAYVDPCGVGRRMI